MYLALQHYHISFVYVFFDIRSVSIYSVNTKYSFVFIYYLFHCDFKNKSWFLKTENFICIYFVCTHMHIFIHTYMCTNMCVWGWVVVMRCLETLCMNWRMSPVFSSFWGQVYSQAFHHLYCLEGEKKKKKSIWANVFFNASPWSVREGCQMQRCCSPKAWQARRSRRKRVPPRGAMARCPACVTQNQDVSLVTWAICI